jgi:hypothetical protein
LYFFRGKSKPADHYKELCSWENYFSKLFFRCKIPFSTKFLGEKFPQKYSRNFRRKNVRKIRPELKSFGDQTETRRRLVLRYPKRPFGRNLFVSYLHFFHFLPKLNRFGKKFDTIKYNPFEKNTIIQSFIYYFLFKSYHPIPWRDSISRPIAPVFCILGSRRRRYH